MTEDITRIAERAHRAAGTFLLVVAAVFTVWAPLFGMTYTQPDMGLIVIIGVVPVLWGIGVLFACLALAFAVTRWQRIAGIVVASALAAEAAALGIMIAINIYAR
jgi:hypothetical protein